MSFRWSLGAAIALCILFPSIGAAAPCEVPDNGTGTIDLPPPGCGYLSPDDVHMIINGLPPGTTINIGIEHQEFFNVVRNPGGVLGGEIEQFDSFLNMHMQGTGGLAYMRDLGMQVQSEIHTAPRTPFDQVQSFDTDMRRSQGQLPPGDPDFDVLRITAGTDFAMPSPGHTTLTRLPSGMWNVDSFFDIFYTIDFVGAPGGPFAGMNGSTTATIRMAAGGPPRCVVPDNGTGTVNLPPPGCGYLSPADVHMIIDGLPAGTTVKLGAEHSRFGSVIVTPGGTLGGEVEQFTSTLQMDLDGTGTLAGYTRKIPMQLQCETHTGPRNPQTSFDTDMFRMGGQLPPGDPDFDLLRITGGTDFGLPSPGHTTLTPLPSGDWNVDSFFDITYRIDFVGAPDGPFAGRSGSTTATIRMATGETLPVGIADESAPAVGTQLFINRPDPYNPSTSPSTRIDFVLATRGEVQLEVYDAAGRLVRRLMNQELPAARYEARWDGLDSSANRVRSGTYFIQLKVDGKLIGNEKVAIVK